MRKNVYLLVCSLISICGCIEQNPAPVEYGTSHSRERNYYPIESDDSSDGPKITSQELSYEEQPDTKNIHDDIYRNSPTLNQQKRNPQDSEHTPTTPTQKQDSNNEKKQNVVSAKNEDLELLNAVEQEIRGANKDSISPKQQMQRETKQIKDASIEQNANAQDSVNTQAAQKVFITKTTIPISGNVSNKFGDVVDGKKLNGVNIKADHNHIKVASVSSGAVVFADSDDQFGNLVIVKSDNEVFYAYAYLKNMHVKQNDNIAVGSILGEIKPDGILHFAVRRKDKAVDPVPYLK